MRDMPLAPAEHSAAIDEAAGWLAMTPPKQRPTPLVPAMRAMLSLSAIDVCAVIRQSHEIREGAHATTGK